MPRNHKTKVIYEIRTLSGGWTPVKSAQLDQSGQLRAVIPGIPRILLIPEGDWRIRPVAKEKDDD